MKHNTWMSTSHQDMTLKQSGDTTEEGLKVASYEATESCFIEDFFLNSTEALVFELVMIIRQPVMDESDSAFPVIKMEEI